MLLKTTETARSTVVATLSRSFLFILLESTSGGFEGDDAGDDHVDHDSSDEWGGGGSRPGGSRRGKMLREEIEIECSVSIALMSIYFCRLSRENITMGRKRTGGRSGCGCCRWSRLATFGEPFENQQQSRFGDKSLAELGLTCPQNRRPVLKGLKRKRDYNYCGGEEDD